MSEIVNQNGIDALFMLFVFAVAGVICWIMEPAWHEDKRWVFAVVVFPLTLLVFIFYYWEESRFKCFIGGMMLLVIMLIGGIIGHNFAPELFRVFKQFIFWEYYLGQHLLLITS